MPHYLVTVKHGGVSQRVLVRATDEKEARQNAIDNMYRQKGLQGTQGFQVQNVVRQQGKAHRR